MGENFRIYKIGNGLVGLDGVEDEKGTKVRIFFERGRGMRTWEGFSVPGP